MGLFAKKKGKLSEKWQYNAQSNLLAGPAVYDVDKDGVKEIVLGTKDGRVVLMGDDSSIKWIYNVNDESGEVDKYFEDAETATSIYDSPVIADIEGNGENQVLFGTESGKVVALSNKGKVLWMFQAEDAVRSSVVVDDINKDGKKEVIFGCMKGFLYILSPEGKELWRHEGHSSIEGSPVIIPHSKDIVFGCHDGSIKCVVPGEGVRWAFQTEGKVVAQPVIENLLGSEASHILVGSTDYHMYVLDEEGKLIWKYRTEGAILSKAAVGDINKDGKKEVVFGSCDNKVYALTHDGDKIWSYETYFWVVAPPIIDDIDGDGKMEVIVGSYDHNLYVLDGEGVYNLDYVPGLGGVIHQSGHYAEMMTSEPGRVEGKKIWHFKTSGFIVGCDLDKDMKNIIVNIKEGVVNDLVHER